MKRVPLYSLVLLSSVVVLLLSACGADESEATPLATVATSSHTGALPAVHMELKRLNSDGEAVGRPVCEVYGTPADTRPEATNCPHGEYKEQLFNEDWFLVEDGERDVTVGPTTDPEPDTPTNPEPDTPTNPEPDTPPSPEDEAPPTNPNRVFYQFEEDSLDELDTMQVSQLRDEDPDWYDIPTEDNDGWRIGAGNFRISCQYSHFSYDDPIVFPGQTDPTDSHLHMFFGNTDTDANTNKDNIAESGGGTCNGFALNRSAYWTPALLDDREKVVIPKTIIVYYKSARVNDRGVALMPQGLQLLGGNISGTNNVPSDESQNVFWSCGANGAEGKVRNDEGELGSRLEETKAGTLSELECDPDEPINATIYFPQCVAKDDSGDIVLSSDDGLSHTFRLEEVHYDCPDNHARIPELAILLYYPPQASLAGWRLDSDMEGMEPGSSLHADWIGGWHHETMEMWVENCNRAKKNCTLGEGETGTETGTQNSLRRALNKDSEYSNHSEICNEDNANDCNNDDWLGPYFMTRPERRR